MPVAAAVPLALSLIQTGIGAANKKAANKEAEELKRTRPQYAISPEATSELSLAESELQQGLGSRAERAYEMASDRGLSNSLSAILKGGGNVNSIGDLYGQQDEGRQRLAMLNENARLNQINSLISADRNMTEQRDKGFMYNQDQWWKNDAQANASAKQGADQQIWSGINGAVSSGAGIWQGISEQNQMNKYLNPTTPTSNAQTTNTTGYVPDKILSNNYMSNNGAQIQQPNFYNFNG